MNVIVQEILIIGERTDLCAFKDSPLIFDLANIFSISSVKSPVEYSITFPVILLFKSRLIFLQQTLKCDN